MFRQQVGILCWMLREAWPLPDGNLQLPPWPRLQVVCVGVPLPCCFSPSSVRMLCCKVSPAEAFPVDILPQTCTVNGFVTINQHGPFLLCSSSTICLVPCSSGTRDWGGELREGEERCFPVHRDLTRKNSALLLYRANPSAVTCQKFPVRFGFSEPCSGVTADSACSPPAG